MAEYLKYLDIEEKCQKGIYNLLKYKKGEESNKFHIWKAYRILKNIDKIVKEKGQFKLEDNEEHMALLFGEADETTKLRNKVRKMRTTKTTLENVLDGADISARKINSAIKYLEQIKKQCVQYETEIIELL
jgi:hypothetical protein